MDWYAWLSTAGLGEAQAAEYALHFARNGLAAADVPSLDHASLAAMGVPVAKHRLQILTLARKQSSSSSAAAAAAITVFPGRATRLLAAAARSLAGRLRSAVLRRDSAAAVAPRPAPVPLLRHHRGGGGAAVRAGSPWKSCRAPAVDRRGGRTTTAASTKMALAACLSKPMLVLVNGRGKGKKKCTATPTVPGCFASTETRSDCDYDADEEEEYDDEMGRGGECSPETPWESMFQDLNPT